MLASFNWPDLAWLIPGAVALIAAVATVTAAVINKRPDAFARLESLLNMQSEQIAALSEHNEKVDVKMGKIYQVAVAQHDYGQEWEKWHADGMPDPPGKPKRPDFIVMP